MKQIPLNTTEVATGVGLDITWQQGPIATVNGRQRANGSTVEQVIYAAIFRLEYLDLQVPDMHNREALTSLYAAIGHLEARTRDRARRGVMGTDQP